MTDSTRRRPLYPHGRASAATSYPGGVRLGRPDYDLISRSRTVCEEGFEALLAAEQYDPDLAVKLSVLADETQVNALLERWLVHRTDILRRTQTRLREVWKAAHLGSRSDGQTD